ncbi:protein MOS2-like [Mangifera indica]|uniref:protein MOS2-like n=1 Tax=Mangifera indica TaxID=29780 RepID=UPI001CFB2A2D|nr:protein MOS2-like [Mangifera indica]
MTSNATKVSFSVQSKSNRKQSKSLHLQHEDQDEVQPTKHFVTEFDPNQNLTDAKPKPRLILPPKSNESRPYKKMKNIDLPIETSDQLQLELHSTTGGAEGAAQITYGLNLRKSVGGNEDEEKASDSVSASEPVERVKSKDVKFDLEELPDDEGFKQFEDMPVEDFGAALLAGLGWYEGRGLGKNPKGNVQIKQIEKKSFVSDDAITGLMSGKEKRKEDKRMDSNGGDRMDKPVKHRRQESEDRENRNGNGSQKHRESEKRGSVNNGTERSSREGARRGSNNDGNKKRRESENRHSNSDEERASWLRRHIRVKIISKEFKKGRWYLNKGEVVDVAGTKCDILMDDGRELIKGVDQDLLETALPRNKGGVLVLYGKHKGVYGSLVNRDMDRNTGIVFDVDTEEYLNVNLEQIAEYTRCPSSIKY